MYTEGHRKDPVQSGVIEMRGKGKETNEIERERELNAKREAKTLFQQN